MASENQSSGISPVMEMIDVAVGSLRTPDRVVLEGINWLVAQGDFWVIGGLLGAGKSDFLCVAAGIMPPMRGIHRLFGKELTGGYNQAQLEERLRLGFVFDGGQLLAHLTLAENIALPVRYHRNYTAAECQELIQPLLQYSGLDALVEYRPGEVGRHWRQRAGLARALTLQPEILLLDDPLSGQDPRHLHWWLDRLGELSAGHATTQGRPLTVVVTGTDLRLWQGVARQFGILKNRCLVTAPAGLAAPEALETLHRDLLEMENGWT
jgi:ABC-type transporter Mla maintaining outer membrane lipid asymmetry ATPase subunit MlaF